jgi:uncharacterized membrane protein YbhN (UPF0104 family)
MIRDKTSSSMRKQHAVRIVGTLGAVLLLAYWLRGLEWRSILDAIARIPLSLFGAAIAIMFLSRMAVSARWYMLLHSTPHKITAWQATRLTFAGLFASNFLPTTIGGDVVRLVGGLQLQLDGAICGASLIVDRLVGMAGMAMILPVGILRFFDLRESAFRGFDHISTNLAAFGAASIAMWPRALAQRVWKFIERVFHALSMWLARPQALLSALVFTWVHMLSIFVILWMFIRSMGDDLSFWLVGGIWSVVYFVTLLPISINGLGVQEVAISFFFSRVGGVPLEIGFTIALLMRTLTMLASLPGIFFVPMILSGREAHAGAERGLL